MTEPRDKADFDDYFDAYLDGKSPVSRRYAQLESEEPWATLDADILEAARSAARPNVVPIKKSPRRWMMPVTVAATIVLSFSLVMSIVFEEPVVMNDVPVVGTDAYVSDTETTDERLDAPAEAPARESTPRAALPASPEPVAASKSSADQDAGRAVFAQKREAEEKMSRADDLAPAVSGGLLSAAPQVDAAGPARDVSELRDGLRELVSAPGGTSLAVAEESRLRRQDGEIVALQSKRAPADADRAGAGMSEGADSELEQILVLFDAGDERAALKALRSFAEQQPDHPAARLYLGWSGNDSSMQEEQP